ncbi:hypothetical protein [Lyngbya confervoides]|uniref:Uncharacterized protein n=1 Tax=Lyngbya confervoides BDU141951 TaxID=1574623 RepID=A0ABD4T7C6_9CYAN|nr:hypothetical protein [Lyngbya confervoides]MCM1984633.1 hypothetical protein [Lyngbya confervoides BDU141951]
MQHPNPWIRSSQYFCVMFFERGNLLILLLLVIIAAASCTAAPQAIPSQRPEAAAMIHP